MVASLLAFVRKEEGLMGLPADTYAGPIPIAMQKAKKVPKTQYGRTGMSHKYKFNAI
jgi:hypothetical protein